MPNAVNIITCGYTGRMGNQMFQIAVTVATAIKHGAQHAFQRAKDSDPWKVYFNYLPEMPQVEVKYHHETSPARFEEISYEGGALQLSGYFQTEKYFKQYRNEITKVFGFKWEPIKNKVSLHVRRGDYVQGTPFEPIEMDYITSAINYFREKGYFSFVVFSDDIDWCKKNVNSNLFTDCTMEYSEGQSEFSDMHHMQCCEHNIIANSTFSWWGAWLNQNPDKIVVAPTKWFNGVNQDLLPEEWIKM